MLDIKGILGKTPKPKPSRKPPPHEKSATVDLIEQAGLMNQKYGYTYWLGKVKRAGVTYNDMVGILKEIKGMDAKYNKGGRLTNVLTARANEIKKKNVKNGTQG